jgi:hypothetical protein
LFQTPLGAPRKLIVVLGDPKYHLLGFFVGYLLGVNARFLGALSPVFRIVNGNLCHDRTVIRAVADKPN